MVDASTDPKEEFPDKWGLISRETLILGPEYIKLPHAKLEEIATKDYPILDGSSDVMPLHDQIYSDFINNGTPEKCAGLIAFSVIEAVQNAQEHAFKWQKFDKNGEVSKIYTAGIFTPKYDIIGISSQGSIDVEKIKGLIAENEKIRYAARGRGFYTMVKLCDVVYLQQGGGCLETMLILIKDDFFEKCNTQQ